MADVKISALPAATAANNTDEYPANQAGTTRKVTGGLLRAGRTTFSNADAVATAADVYLAQVGTLSAARTVTLPAANAVPAGYQIVVADESGSPTDTNTITVQRAGADTINGLTSVVIKLAYGALRFVSDGTSKWTVLGLQRIPAITYLCASNNFVPANPATAEFPNFGLEGSWVIADLSNVTQMRVTGRVLVVSGADLTLEARIQYATNFTSPTWAYVDGSAGPAVNMGTSGGVAGSWANITAAARTNVMLRAVTVSATPIQIRVPWLGFQIR